MTTLEERVSRLEGAYEQLDQRLGDIQASLHALNTRINALDAKLDALGARLDERIDTLEAQMNAQFRTLVVVMATGGIAIAGAIVTLAFRI